LIFFASFVVAVYMSLLEVFGFSSLREFFLRIRRREEKAPPQAEIQSPGSTRVSESDDDEEKVL